LGTDLTATPKIPIILKASFDDPSADDGPWSHTIDWGDGTVEGNSTTANSIIAGHTFAAHGVYTVVATVADKDGAMGSDTLRVSVLPAEPVLVGAGNIVRCSSDHDEATARLLDGIAGTVITLGDNVYDSASIAEFENCYAPTWGRHKARTRPVPGNHDYRTEGAAGYFEYFGAAAGDPDKGYYSYDIGAWHVIALNSRISMRAGSVQERWLRADLTASKSLCTLAYFHDARFYSAGSDGVSSAVKPAWDALYEAGAEVVLNSERRFYERFAPQTPDGEADPSWGIRQFIVGTGGWSSGSFGTVRPNSEVREGHTFGVLKLTLHDSAYDWEFIPVAGEPFRDSGSGICHGPPGN
jgi:PKD repeat protein